MSRTISAKVNDELLERIEEAREGEPPDQETRSAAMTRLIRDGLDAQEEEDTPPTLLIMMWVGTLLIAMQYASATDPAGPVGLGLVALAILLDRDAVSARLKAVYAGLSETPNQED
jgi:hypothetical protein